jgi:hypothetical protein
MTDFFDRVTSEMKVSPDFPDKISTGIHVLLYGEKISIHNWKIRSLFPFLPSFIPSTLTLPPLPSLPPLPPLPPSYFFFPPSYRKNGKLGLASKF